MTKACSACRRELPDDAFNRDKSKASGLASQCRECHKATAKRWYAENTEHCQQRGREWAAAHRARLTAYQQEWREKNRDALRERRAIYNRANRDMSNARVNAWRARQGGGGGVLTPDDSAALMAAYGWRCAYCGSSERVGIDHLVPISRAGENTIENAIPACLTCNGSKHKRTPLEWLLSDTPRAQEVVAKLVHGASMST